MTTLDLFLLAGELPFARPPLKRVCIDGTDPHCFRLLVDGREFCTFAPWVDATHHMRLVNVIADQVEAALGGLPPGNRQLILTETPADDARSGAAS